MFLSEINVGRLLQGGSKGDGREMEGRWKGGGREGFYILYNKGVAVFVIDRNQEVHKKYSKIENFSGKVLVVQKKAVPLHPQIRNTT